MKNELIVKYEVYRTGPLESTLHMLYDHLKNGEAIRDYGEFYDILYYLEELKNLKDLKVWSDGE